MPYGKIPNTTNGFGYISDPNLISSTGKFDPTKSYTDMVQDARSKGINNYDVEFHESADHLQRKNAESDLNFGEVRVLDQDGNIVILPYNKVQGSITYYQPGSFPFGSSTYIPKYEDSVYLSRSTNAIVNTPTYVTSNVGGGFCNKYKADPIQLEQQCNKINN